MWKLPDRSIICVDMKCFYASCMAMLYNLDVDEVPIAVVGNFEQRGSIVLAASPAMKQQFGIKTGNRLYEIPQHPSIRLFEPKMSFFLTMSMNITRLISRFVPKEAIHVYSVDESFVDLHGTEKLWGSAEETAKLIQRSIYQQFKIKSAIGMGPNMLVAKLALDLEAKKTGFAKWGYKDIEQKLWPIKPLSRMWGIGSKMEKNLNELGIYSVGDLAKYHLKDLEKRYGVMGAQLYYHAHGIDFSTLGEPITKGQISFGKGQMLMRDYTTKGEIETVLLEMCEDVMQTVREAGYVGRTVALGLSYSRQTMKPSFYRSLTLDEATNDTLKIYEAIKKIFYAYFEKEPVRQIAIRVSKVEVQHSVQLDLFDEQKERRQTLAYTMDKIKRRYGKASLCRAISLTKAGTAIQRTKLVGGHKR
ncbi:MAG: UV damage repair protein UvrX [Kurthia sp.]|nr:UV damage repair protein UvrX [Candidatus Kurthia equi]